MLTIYNWGGSYPQTDANGYPNNPLALECIGPNLPGGSLIGRVNVQMFELGDDTFNFPPPGTGNLELIFNDNPNAFANNTGSMVYELLL